MATCTFKRYFTTVAMEVVVVELEWRNHKNGENPTCYFLSACIEVYNIFFGVHFPISLFIALSFLLCWWKMTRVVWEDDEVCK